MENKPFEPGNPGQPQQQVPPVPPQNSGYYPPPQNQSMPPRFSPPPYGSGQPMYQPVPRREINILEVLSMIFGALAIVSTFFYIYVQILGLIFGIVGTILAIMSKREKYGQLGIWGLVVSLFSSGLIMFLIFQHILETSFNIYL